MKSLRPSTWALAFLGLMLLAFAGIWLDAAVQRTERAGEIDAMRALATRLGLTDPALFTEARYTRHPSQADLHSAFQDHPLTFEHFPSGSLVPPRHDFLADPTNPPD